MEEEARDYQERQMDHARKMRNYKARERARARKWEAGKERLREAIWRHEAREYEGDFIAIDDTSEIPPGFNGEALHINDHGNCTLYRAVRGRTYEIASCV
jgi:hypothetical protein